MYKNGCDIEKIKLRAAHKKVIVTINSYIEGHRKNYLDSCREKNASRDLLNLTVN